MSSEAEIKQAMQQQALLLREEYSNLEELRDLVKPFYNQWQKRPELHVESKMGQCQVWWAGKYWTIVKPDGKSLYTPKHTLREILNQTLQQLKEDSIAEVMQTQVSRLRDEYGDLEEVLSWARPLYNHEDERPELRFDSPVGICSVWWETIRWAIRIPDGSITYCQPGKLRESLTHTRQFLRKGII